MTLDNTQNNIQTVTEERIRQLVALFPGKGEIKNTILKGLEKYGYTDKEAKKLYNFIESMKHMLPESPKYKPESTIKKNISLLIMLAEVMPEVQVALFGGSTEACLARLASKVDSNAKAETSSKSHPGISGRRKQKNYEEFVTEVLPKLNEFQRYKAMLSEVCGTIGQIDQYGYNPSIIEPLYTMLKTNLVLKNLAKNKREDNGSTLLYDYDLQTTSAYKYIAELIKDYCRAIPSLLPYDQLGFYKIKIHLLQLCVFLSHMMLKIVKFYFNYLANNTFRVAGKSYSYKFVYENCDVIDFLELFDRTVYNSKLLLSEGIFYKDYIPFLAEQDYSERLNKVTVLCEKRKSIIGLLDYLIAEASKNRPTASTVMHEIIISNREQNYLTEFDSTNAELLDDLSAGFRIHEISPMAFLNQQVMLRPIPKQVGEQPTDTPQTQEPPEENHFIEI